MHCYRTLLCVYVVYTCLHVCACAVESGNGFTSENMKQMVKSMLGFKDFPGSKKSFLDKKEAPQYMLDLYERFKDRPVSVGQSNSNTVRSIEAKISESFF